MSSSNRIASLWFPFLSCLGLLALGGCATSSAPKTVSLRLTGELADATVTIDDQYLGSFAHVKHRGVALPPGRHRISVEQPGHFPWDQEVDVHEGDPPVRFLVQLKPIPE